MSGAQQAVFQNQRSFGPTVIGEAFGGGFYAGQISTTANGVATHYLIVAPLASGQSTLQYKTSNTQDTGATSQINGPLNSSQINDASHPAAQFCEGLSIGGFTDWYMPSLYELEICYFNLKPTTTTNDTALGQNFYSVPSRGGVNYTSGTPAQTTATAFKSGGAEAFTAANYWTSSQYTAASPYVDAWIDSFSNGTYTNSPKTTSLRVRAVRRIPV